MKFTAKTREYIFYKGKMILLDPTYETNDLNECNFLKKFYEYEGKEEITEDEAPKPTKRKR